LAVCPFHRKDTHIEPEIEAQKVVPVIGDKEKVNQDLKSTYDE
jgi:hypothetical protein